MKLNLHKNKTALLITLLVLLNGFLAVWFLSPQKNMAAVGSWEGRSFPEVEADSTKALDFAGYSGFLRELSNDKGGEYAFHALAYAARQNLIAGNIDTHLLGHVVGDQLYKQQGIQGIKVCTDDLRNACSHSIVVGALIDSGPQLLPDIVKVCEQAPGGPGAYSMCVHGLGHGVLGYTEYDLRAAVELCAATNTEKYRRVEEPQCVGGATMEMMAGVHDREAWEKQIGNYLKDDDPLAPCNQDFIPDRDRSFCYVYLTPHLFEAAGMNLGTPDPSLFAKSVSFCQGIPEDQPGNRNTCYGSFGKEYVVLANNRNVQSVEAMTPDQLSKVYEWCKLTDIEEAVMPCITSAMQSLYWGGENSPDVSIRFCAIIPDAGESRECMDALVASVNQYIKDLPRREDFCRRVTPDYAPVCRSKLL